MANKRPNTTGLEQFTSETARKAAAKSAEVRRLNEPLKPKTIKIYARQEKEIIRRGIKLSDFVRRKLDEEFRQ